MGACLNDLETGGEGDQNQPQRVRQLLHFCSASIAGGDFDMIESAQHEIVDFLSSIYGKITSDLITDESKSSIRDVLEEIRRYILCPSLDQQILDAMSFEVPKAVAKLAVVDDDCMLIVDGVIQYFVERCTPRDMLSIFCEALVTSENIFKPSSYFAPILRGLSKVITSITKHHYEQIKVAVPVVLRILKAGYADPDADISDTALLFNIAIDIADSIQVVCARENLHEKFHVLLGLYVLQATALASYAIGDKHHCLPFLMRISPFVPYCGFSYIDLATGKDLEKFIAILCKGNEDEYAGCFFDVKYGAALSVVWGYTYSEVAQAATQNLDVGMDHLRRDCTKRWQALDRISVILTSFNLSWKIKQKTIEFLMDIVNGCVSDSTEYAACESYTHSIYSCLEAIEMVIICAPDNVLRKNSLCLFKMILVDVPACQRNVVFKTFVRNSKSPSMVAIFIDLLKELLGIELSAGTSARKSDPCLPKIKGAQPEGFWNCGLLEVVELVLRPPQGGPPHLPEQSDAVLSALNLYRFILIAEKTGGERGEVKGVVWTREGLRKAYEGWLLPLRSVVTGVMARHEDVDDSDEDGDDRQVSLDVICALNPVQFVLYRCIELVEEGMLLL